MTKEKVSFCFTIYQIVAYTILMCCVKIRRISWIIDNIMLSLHKTIYV